jgi:hypothetical protein
MILHRWTAAPPGQARTVALIARSALYLAPPGTPKEDEWKYGTGDDAHNPIVCQSFIRYLCEAGAGEFEGDDQLKKIIRSLVGIKPIA